MIRRIRLGTRGSRLALWQTAWVEAAVRAKIPEAEIEQVVIRVESDRRPEVPITAMASRGVFTRDIEVALLDGEIDAAVHSLKDLPSEDAQGLSVVATSPREDPRDALLSVDGAQLHDLAADAVVGTSSLRRAALLREARPGLGVEPIRGNIDTRIRKLRAGDYAAIMMAAAALNRLDASVPAQLLPVDPWVPAVAQGIIGVQARTDDAEVVAMLAMISDEEAMLCASVERAFLRSLGGGCSVPVGGYAALRDGTVELTGFVGSPDGRRILRLSEYAPVASAAVLGPRVARALTQQGADAILEELRSTAPLLRAE